MPKINFDWKKIESGPFLMGTSEEDCKEFLAKYSCKTIFEEAPRKSVFVRAFEISAYPITNRQFKAFIDDSGYLASAWLAGFSSNALDHPVRNVNIVDAMAFCHWAGCRLPTQVEWEKAAAGPNGQKYPWGNSWKSGLCNSLELNLMTTTEVGMFPGGKSPFGLFDMAGNVWEWTSSTMVSNRDTSVWWAFNNPKWSPRRQHEEYYIEGYDIVYKTHREWYVLKGGGADSNEIGIRCSFFRREKNPNLWADFVGFRCVKL